MRVLVLLFAQVREIIGADNIEIELQPSQESTVSAAEIKQAVQRAAQADEAVHGARCGLRSVFLRQTCLERRCCAAAVSDPRHRAGGGLGTVCVG